MPSWNTKLKRNKLFQNRNYYKETCAKCQIRTEACQVEF
jgi:hypothetical protein